MFYHKVYMNQIHSSSLLCQLASMWKNQVLCDAVIKAGNNHIKAHRVVLVAACPMLHSMKNASVGSNLEVRLAADIKVEAINTFLQYLYEGFMMLTEENSRDVEKIARVLQVDSVLKCCADFYKCLHAGDRYEYSFHDSAEFKHVRASDLLKVHERNKRSTDVQPPSPGAKRQRIQNRGSSDSFINEFGAGDPWDRVPREGLSGSSSMRTNQPGVIEIMEDSVEIVHTDKPEDSGGTRRDNPQDRMSLSVASQMKANTDVQIINASSAPEPPSRAKTSNSDSSLFSSHPSLSHSQGSSSMGFRHDPNFTNPNSTSGARLPTSPSSYSRMPSPSSAYHLPQRTSAHSQPKPFAAGNAAQASKSYNLPSPGEPPRSGSQDQSRVTAGASTVSFSSSSSSLGGPPSSSPNTSTQPPQPVALWRSTSSDAVASGSSAAQMSEKPLLQRSESTPATSDADISIVKVESEVSFDEQFHGDDPGVTFEPDDHAGDWNREDTSNEESNASEDKMPQWMTDSMKANTTEDRPSPSGDSTGGRSKLSEYIDKLHELQTKAMYFDMVRNRPKVSATTDASDEAESADASSEVLKGLDLTIRSSQQKHVPIYNKDRKYTPCLYCGRLKNRTRSGWRVNTFYRCLQCDVPLCVNDRNCFVLYHKYFLGMTNVESPGRRRSRDTSHAEVKKESNG